MSRVWWCEEHDVLSRHSETNCWWAATWEPKPCRMVPMRLVPADAEGAIIGNVVAVLDRGLVNGKPYAEPWRVTICTTAEPEKFTRYALVPLASQVGESR